MMLSWSMRYCTQPDKRGDITHDKELDSYLDKLKAS